MSKEFIPYAEALALKELGFDEECLGFYMKEGLLRLSVMDKISIIKNSVFLDENNCVAPLYQQAFRWFRKEHRLYHSIGLDNSLENDVNCDYQIINHSQSVSELESGFKSYEEAEIACLRKLIEIVKNKQ